MGLKEVEDEADRLQRNLHNRRTIGFVNGFRNAVIILKSSGGNGLSTFIKEWRPTEKYDIPTDEYDIGYRKGMEKALKMFNEEEIKC